MPLGSPSNPVPKNSASATSTSSTSERSRVVVDGRSQSDSWIDMSALMRIKDMPLRAKSVVDGFHNGLHRSPLHGFSVEFSEYRPFSVGDDPRTIDWKLFARSDRFYVKKFEDETNRRCYLVIDQSKSMNYGSVSYTKMEYARTLAATLAYYLTLQRDAVGLLTFEAAVTEFLTARFRTGQLKRIMSLLAKQPNGTATDLQQPLFHLAEMVRQRSLIIVISDFLVPAATLEQPLSFLRARNHEIMLMRVVDPAEVALQVGDAAMLVDLESGRELHVDPEAARISYQAKYAEHENALREMAGRMGISWTSLTTTDSIEFALFDLLHRQQNGQKEAGRTRGAEQVVGGKP